MIITTIKTNNFSFSNIRQKKKAFYGVIIFIIHDAIYSTFVVFWLSLKPYTWERGNVSLEIVHTNAVFHLSLINS